MRNSTIRHFVLLLIIVLVISTVPAANADPAAGLEVHFIDIGHGDCSLVLCGGKTMLIVGCDSTGSELVIAYLEKLGITNPDYVISAGADYDTPSAFSAASMITQAVENPLDFGNACTEILSGANDNDSSLIVRLTYGNTSFLFMGDSGHADEQALLQSGIELSSTVLKVSGHGSADASCLEFLKAVQPKISVISVGAENTESLPSEEALGRLEEYSSEIYRTDLNGTIIIRSDGTSVSVECEKAAVPEITYVLNTNSHKFHYPNCKSVKSMKDKNRKDFYGTREEAIAMGYDPCGNCHP